MFEIEVDARVATLEMRHPPVNALSRAWAAEFNRILGDLEARNDWRVLLIRSGIKVFSAGGDVKEFASRLSRPSAGDELAQEAALYQALFNRIQALPQVSIAQIAGVAAGGGFELALACDLRIAAESARVGLPEVGLGLLPSAGGTQRLTRLCGTGRAMRLIGAAELIRSRDAANFGLVEWVLPDEGFSAAADEIAKKLAAQPHEALQAAKSCIAAAVDPTRDGFAAELAAPRYLMNTVETRARIEDFVAKLALRR